MTTFQKSWSTPSHKIYVERLDHTFEDTDLAFDSEAQLIETINALLAFGNKKLDETHTSAKIILPNYSHFVAMIPPTALSGPSLIIRKHRPDPLSMDQVIGFNAISQEAADYLTNAVKQRANILISGGEGSGKTTVVNILTESYKPNERVIVVEKFADLQPRNTRLIRMGADTSPDMNFAELVIMATRMRPDRLLFGEFKRGEAMYAIDAMSNGHSGTLASIHANSVEHALSRLETMCAMSNLGYGLLDIRTEIASTLNIVVASKHYRDKSKRRITQISEIHGIEHDRYILQPIFRYDEENDKLNRVSMDAIWGS